MNTHTHAHTHFQTLTFYLSYIDGGVGPSMYGLFG